MSFTSALEHAVLLACGGRPITHNGKVSARPEETVTYNFGVRDPQTVEGFRIRTALDTTPTLHERYPKMKGAWDGTGIINHCDAALKVLGSAAEVDKLIQYQPRGTCGGRAGSAAGDFVQLIQIALGKRAKFHRVSHAAVYYAARKLYSDVGGNWQDDNNDGVVSGSVPVALQKVAGYVQRDEDDDQNYYGDGSDDLACQLAAGMRQDVAAKILSAGSDNIITEQIKVSSAQELADGIAAGGIGIGSDMQGFTMSRDRYGRCLPSGTWSHYQIRVSVGKFDFGPGFGYWQSWGKTTPSGNLLKGHPGNCFGVDFATQDRIIKSGNWSVIFGMPLWDLEEAPKTLPWIY